MNVISDVSWIALCFASGVHMHVLCEHTQYRAQLFHIHNQLLPGKWEMHATMLDLSTNKR